MVEQIFKIIELHLQDFEFEVLNGKLKDSLWGHKKHFDFLLFYFEKKKDFGSE